MDFSSAGQQIMKNNELNMHIPLPLYIFNYYVIFNDLFPKRRMTICRLHFLWSTFWNQRIPNVRFRDCTLAQLIQTV